jgi:O-antigen ligase
MSLGASRSLAASLFLLSIAGLFVASAIICRNRKIKRRLTWVMAAAAAFQILYGTVSFQGGTIWGVDVPHDPFRLRGTFVNPNHFAMYLEICWAITIAWAWRAWTRSRREHHLDRRILRVAPLVLFMLLIFAAIAFSGSRAGLLAALAALIAQGFLIATTFRRWRFGVAGAAILAVACTGLVAVVGLQRGLGRFLATSPYEVRMNHRLIGYKATLELWQDFKLFGTGLGTFGEAFPRVQPEALSLVWRHAHNDYLELLATTGVLGFALFCSGLFFFVRGHWKALRHEKRSEDLAGTLAILGVTTAVAVHSCFDFGLTIPANAATLAIVCGAGAAVAFPELRTQNSEPGTQNSSME